MPVFASVGLMLSIGWLGTSVAPNITQRCLPHIKPKLRDKVLAPSDFNIKQPAKPKEVKRRFAESAKQHSDHAASARGGGDLGVVMSGTLDPHLEHAARTLAPGAVRDEIQTPQGLHLLMRQP